MTLATPTTRIETTTDAVDAARVIGGCPGPGASARLRDSGLLGVVLAPADGGVSPSTATEVVRVLAVSHLDLARQVRRSLIDGDESVGHDLVARLLDTALETGSAAAALHGVIAAARELDGAGSTARPRLGELATAVSAAEATLARAGVAVDAVRTSPDDPDLLRDEAHAALAVATVLASRAATDAAQALIHVSTAAVHGDTAGASGDTADLDLLGGWVLTGRIAR
ncbi:hypothetical protein ACXVUM_06130 [Williamsia sp. SKLECPSW1]